MKEQWYINQLYEIPQYWLLPGFHEAMEYDEIIALLERFYAQEHQVIQEPEESLEIPQQTKK